MKPCLWPLAVGFIKLLPNPPWWFPVPVPQYPWSLGMQHQTGKAMVAMG